MERIARAGRARLQTPAPIRCALAGGADHAFAASDNIVTPGGETVTVNQRIEGGRWHLIKTVTLAANDNWKVELSDQAPGEVVAGAVAITLWCFGRRGHVGEKPLNLLATSAGTQVDMEIRRGGSSGSAELGRSTILGDIRASLLSRPGSPGSGS